MKSTGKDSLKVAERTNHEFKEPKRSREEDQSKLRPPKKEIMKNDLMKPPDDTFIHAKSTRSDGIKVKTERYCKTIRPSMPPHIQRRRSSLNGDGTDNSRTCLSILRPP